MFESMWARMINAGIGIWLMCAPAVLQDTGLTAKNDRVVGPIVAAVAIIACWEVMRALRWVNLLAGLWLAAFPWLFGYNNTSVMLNGLVCGLAVSSLALVRGKITQKFGGGWSALWKDQSEQEPPVKHSGTH